MSAAVLSLRAYRAALQMQRAGWPLAKARAFAEALELIGHHERVITLVDHGLSMPEARRWLAVAGYTRREACAGCGATITAYDCLCVRDGRAYCGSGCGA